MTIEIKICDQLGRKPVLLICDYKAEGCEMARYTQTMLCTYRVYIQHYTMQAKGLQHAPDSKLRQGCPSCSAVGVVAVWTADDHSQACCR